MPQTILLTAAKEDTEEIVNLLSCKDFEVLHTSLERYTGRKDDDAIFSTLENLSQFENIVYGSKRNAKFFLTHANQLNKMETIKERLNLAFDEQTFAYLEEEGLAAVHPQNGSEAIDLVELMLMLQRLGATLYPCGSHRREDFPGLLQELDIPVTELDVFDLEGPSDEALLTYQQELSKRRPGIIIFHSRRSVNRTLAAFPELDYEFARVISADKGITNKLQENGITVDAEAEGSWKSIMALVSEM